jgi:hypothetical protein
MSQIQSGYNYNTTTNKIVTATNLNNHVANSILLPGAISEQQTLTDPVSTSDKLVMLDASAGVLVNTTLLNLWQVLPTDLIVSTITNKTDFDIIVQQNVENENPTKSIFAMDVHVGKPSDSTSLSQYLYNIDDYPNEGGVLSVNKNIVNAGGATGTGPYISSLNFGYLIGRQPDSDHRGNSFHFFGHSTTFSATDNPATGYSNNQHPVNIYGNLSVLDGDGAGTNTVSLTVQGDIYANDVISNGLNLKTLLPKAMGRFDKDGIPEGTKNFNIVCLKDGTGLYEITFDTPMSDEFYMIFASVVGKGNPDASIQAAFEIETTRTVNGFTLRTKNFTSSGTSAWANLPFSVMVYDL